MRALALFNVDFCEWPIAVLEAIARRQGGLSATGVVVIDSSTRDHIAARSGLRIDPLYCISDLEADWLVSDPDRDRLARYTKELGREAIAEISVADRELSGGWVSGGVTALTPLRAAARDPDRWVAYLVGVLDFVGRIFSETRFDFVLSNPPQDAVTVAVGAFAKVHGVPFLCPKAIGFLSKTCLFDDVKAMMPCFRRLFVCAEADPSVIADRLDRARKVLADFRRRPVQPDYMKIARRATLVPPSPVTLAALLWRTLCRRPPEAVGYPFPFARFTWELRRWMRALHDRNHRIFGTLDDIAPGPFAYFTLHYEPESSTQVASPWLTDQLAVVEALAKALPAGWKLLVKEHVPMLGRRPSGFYRRLAGMPKVVPISPYENGFAVLRRADLTVTITGTVGLEAVIFGRPVIFLGPSPVQALGEGFVFCPELTRLPAAIDRALVTPMANEERLVCFVACLLEQSVDLPSDLVWGGVGKITRVLTARHPEVTERFAMLILDWLKGQPTRAGV